MTKKTTNNTSRAAKGKTPKGAATSAARGKPAAKAAAKKSKAKPAPWLPPVFEPAKGKAGGARPAAKAGSSAPRGAKPARAAKTWTDDPRTAGTKSRDKTQAAPARSTSMRDPFAEREAQRYARPIPSREAILALLGEQGSLMKTEVLARALGLSSEQDVEALSKRLAAMVRDGQLLQNRRGGYGVAEKLDLIAGVVLANAEGYGFLRPDSGGEDLYLSPAQMRPVLHGDRVLGSVIGVDRRGRRQGAIVEVLERRSPRLVGRVIVENGLTLVAPDDRRLHQDVLIRPGESQGARAGQIVIAEISDPPTAYRGPMGKILAVLGERLTPSILVEMAIASHGLPHEWPQAALREAAEVEPSVSPAASAGRTDLRGLPLVTIDGEDARDFDDAVYAEPNAHGFRLVVAIADVSQYVRVDSALDEEAFNRATSVYFPGFVVPMLPEALSNGICSLNPRVDRLCMVCDMQVDRNGEVTRSTFHEAVMRSHARLTYTRVWQAIGERDADARDELGALLPHVEHLHQLYKLLAKARQKRGSIDFESSEVKFRLGAAGEVIQLDSEPRNDAHKLIEECMIAANVEAAKFLIRKRIPAPFRVHEPPPASKYDDLLEFLREFKLGLPPAGEVRPADFAALLKKIRNRADVGLIESVLLRSQSLAVYQPENTGHFGLALEAYTHFTSPIRRYPDLLVHRAIRHAISGGKPATHAYSPTRMASMAVHCSHNERRAQEAERDVDERYKCAWMEKHVGSEFDGVVSGVASFGLFVELTDSKITGLVHITQLPNDYYHFDPLRHLLTGERRGMKFRLGDAVRVQVLRASLEDRKIDFRLVAEARG